MTTALFVHGAGEDANEADRKLVEGLRSELGDDHGVRYPPMPLAVEYGAWKQQIALELAELPGEVVLVGHSFGGSVLLKYLSEEPGELPARALFLIAPPFWGAEDWTIAEFELKRELAARLPEELKLFFYFSRDDQVVPFSHLQLYRDLFPSARFREVAHGGHQFDDGLSVVARDIESLSETNIDE